MQLSEKKLNLRQFSYFNCRRNRFAIHAYIVTGIFWFTVIMFILSLTTYYSVLCITIYFLYRSSVSFESSLPEILFNLRVYCSFPSNRTKLYTVKKEKKIFLIYKEIQNGLCAKSDMRKSFLIFEEMLKYLVIYDFAPDPLWISLINLFSFFNTVQTPILSAVFIVGVGAHIVHGINCLRDIESQQTYRDSVFGDASSGHLLFTLLNKLQVQRLLSRETWG